MEGKGKESFDSVGMGWSKGHTTLQGEEAIWSVDRPVHHVRLLLAFIERNAR